MTQGTILGGKQLWWVYAAWAASALVAFVNVGCASIGDSEDGQEPSFGQDQQALTSEQARVLNFETPTADWTSNAGTLGTSSNASSGATALTVVPAGWTEINSISLSTLANVRDTLSYDIYLPQVPSWGETRAILTSPSLGQWWTELGRQELNQLPAGQYSTVSFPLSSSLVTLLSGSYSDLKIKLVINAPALSQPYRLDHLVMTNEGVPPPSGSTEPETFTVLLPSGVGVQDTFMSATDHLSLFSQARAGVAGAVPAIANFGPYTTYLQAEARAYADIFSAGPVQLDVKTRVEGSVTTEGTIGKQGVGTNDAPVITGGQFPNTAVTSDAISWTVEWPTTAGPDIQLNAAPTQTPVNTTLPPGVYGDLNVHSRNHVFLSSGTYFFDTFNTEPEAQLRLNTSGGGIVIYVKQNLPWGGGIGSKAPVFTDMGDEAQLLLAFLGAGDVFVQGSWQGTIVAPAALIKLERPSNPGLPGPAPSHRGAFFGKSIEVAAGQHTVRHVPLEGGLPPVGTAPTATEAFDVPVGVTGPYANPAFDDDGGFLLDGGTSVLRVSATGTITPIFPVGPEQRFVLDPKGRRLGTYTQTHFQVRDLSGAVLASFERERQGYAQFVPGGELVFLPRIGDDLERTEATHARFYSLTGLVAEFPTPGLIKSVLTDSHLIYTTQTEVIKVAFSGAETWRLAVSLVKFEASANGQLGVGLLRQQGLVEVVHLDLVGGSVIATQALPDSLWNIAIAAGGRYSALTTQKHLFRFDSGQLAQQVPLPLEWTISVDIADNGLVAVGGQLANHNSVVALLGKAGTAPWEFVEGQEFFATRPSVRFFPDGSRITLNETVQFTVFDVEGSL